MESTAHPARQDGPHERTAQEGSRLILDYVYEHEAALAEQVFLTQPIGGGLAPGARVAMLAKNSAHFIIAELAIWMAGATTVAIFPTESAQNVRFVLEHSEASLLFVGKLDTWPQQQGAIPAGLRVVALPLAPPTSFETWSQIVARSAPLGGRPARRGDDLAMLMYTSGSTGQPKGVMHGFTGITRVAEGIAREAERREGAQARARILSYLPLAHVFERAWVECSSLVSGRAQLYFTEALPTFIDDLKRARPTLFISVPRLWTKFQQSVLAHMPAAQLDALLADPATAPAVGRKVLQSLGLDAVVRAGSGSAPCPAELIAWYRRLGLDLNDGYAMTEDFAYSHRATPQAATPGCVGVPFPEVEVRLDADGEILIKSPGQMLGYYKRPDLNAEAFTADGFFRTGDLGERQPDGQLKLVGRKKELFKTGKGKYVAPAPIENRLNAHPMIELSLVSGVGQPAPYAIVLLDENLRPRVDDPPVREQVQAQLESLLQRVNEDLPAHERLRMLVVAREPWSIENGCLTPTMKIKRARIEASVQQAVAAWYESPAQVVWA